MNKETHLRMREIKAKDLEVIVTLFKETVYHVNAKDYTPEKFWFGLRTTYTIAMIDGAAC